VSKRDRRLANSLDETTPPPLYKGKDELQAYLAMCFHAGARPYLDKETGQPMIPPDLSVEEVEL